MIFDACAMAVLATTGFYLLYQKLPRNIRRWITKHALLTDFVTMILTYWMFGGGITALMAGAMVDILVSIMLHIANHPEDFEWLFDAFRQMRAMLDKVQVYLTDINTTYKASKLVPAPQPEVQDAPH